VIIWSGKLERNGTIVIEGESASTGSVRGALPGVPVLIEVEPQNEIGIAEAPSPSNGWKRLALRSRNNRNNIVVTIRWRALGR
jgi:hypothetical protein